MKLWNKNICLTSRVSLLIIVSLMLSTWVIASVYKNTPVVEEIIIEKEVKVWEPTKEDIAFQTEMYEIIERTQLDLDTIRAGIDRILYKLERAAKYKIVVIPTILIFNGSEEVGRYQANIMMVMEATQKEIQDKVSEILTKGGK